MRVLLSEMTSAEAAEAFAQAQVAVLPTGGHEQHGPHLPLGHDTAVAAWLASKAAEELYPQVLVAPPIPYAYAPAQMGFAGTVSLRIKTLVDLSVEIHRSLHEHGIDKVVTLNAQSTKVRPLYLASRVARDYAGTATAYVSTWDFLPDDIDSLIPPHRVPGRGGEYDTSLALHLFPDSVRSDRIDGGLAESLDERLPAHHRFLTKELPEYSKTGVYSGDPEAASPELGRRLADAALAGLVDFLLEFIRTGDQVEADS